MICPLSHLEDAEHAAQYTTRWLKKNCVSVSPTPRDLCSTLAVRMRHRQGAIEAKNVDTEAHFWWLHKKDKIIWQNHIISLFILTAIQCNDSVLPVDKNRRREHVALVKIYCTSSMQIGVTFSLSPLPPLCYVCTLFCTLCWSDILVQWQINRIRAFQKDSSTGQSELSGFLRRSSFLWWSNRPC